MPPLIKKDETKKSATFEKEDAPIEPEQNFDDLNTIIDEAIKEVSAKDMEQEQPKLHETLEEPKEKEYKLTKQDAFEIKDYLIRIKDIQIESKDTLYKSLIEILKETHFIKKSQSTNNKTTYTLMFVAGVAFGMADTKWMPFASVIYEFGKSVLGK